MAVRVIGAVAVLALLYVPGFAIADIVASVLPGEDGPDSVNAMDAHAGAVVGVLAAGGFAAQVVRPGVAGLQQVALVAVALAAAALLAGEPIGLAGAAVVAVLAAVAVAAHPDRRRLFARGAADRVLVLLAVAVAVPWVAWAVAAAADGRADRPPHSSYALIGSGWAAICALGLALPLVALLAGTRPPGWRASAWSAAAASALVGLSALVHPAAPASLGRWWGAAALAWAAAFAAAAHRAR